MGKIGSVQDQVVRSGPGSKRLRKHGPEQERKILKISDQFNRPWILGGQKQSSFFLARFEILKFFLFLPILDATLMEKLLDTAVKFCNERILEVFAADNLHQNIFQISRKQTVQNKLQCTFLNSPIHVLSFRPKSRVGLGQVKSGQTQTGHTYPGIDDSTLSI